MLGKTLFLDFDGVLHPSICSPSEYFSRLPVLEAALGESSVGIVISSSWRFHHAWPSLLARFPRPLRANVRGYTGDAVTGRHARWREIGNYCAKYDIKDWRALDDSAFEFPSTCPEMILCNGSIGIANKQTELIVT